MSFLEKKSESLSVFLITTTAFLLTAWWFFLYSLTLLDRFSWGFVSASLIIVIILWSYGFFRNLPAHRKAFRSLGRRDVLIALATFIIAIVGIVGFFLTALAPLRESPTIFSGRDQGSYSLAALHLAHTGSEGATAPVIQAFSALAGTGKALNFPGFAYTDTGALVPEFPIGSIVWYAAFVSVFGLIGFFLANVVTATLSTLLFFSLARFSLPLRWSLFGTILFAVSFPLFWFGRFTLSENFALMLFLLLAVQATRLIAWRPTNPIFFFQLCLTGIALTATRIEGWPIFALALILCLSISAIRQSLTVHGNERTRLIIVAAAVLLLISTTLANLPFYHSLASTLWHQWTDAAQRASDESFFPALVSLWRILWLYQLAPVFLIGGLSAILIAAKKRSWITLVPLFLALPTLLYLVSPHISGDHPWMLRRFDFTLWPVFLLLAVIGISTLDRFLHTRSPRGFFARAFAPILLVALALPILTVSVRFLPITENPTLLADTNAVAVHFSPRDLVLVDRLASGDPWSMLAGPLYSVFGLQSAYFFNPDDLQRLPLGRFDNVYFLTDINTMGAYSSRFGDHVTLAGSYAVTLDRLLQITSDPTSFPTLQTNHTTGVILKYTP